MVYVRPTIDPDHAQLVFLDPRVATEQRHLRHVNDLAALHHET